MMPVQIEIDFTFREAAAEQKIITENNLQQVRLSCYTAPEGARCADGTIPYEGVIASNAEHLGMVCYMYNQDLCQVARWECHDVGGNQLLRDGKAIDVYRDSLERCYEMIGRYGDYVYIRWEEE